MAAPIPECLPGDPGDNCQPIRFQVLCDDNQSFLRRYQINCDTGTVIGIVDTLLDGITAYVPVGDVVTCADTAGTVAVRELCDLGSGAPGFQNKFLRIEIRNSDGTIASSFDTEADGVTPYVPIGPVDFDCDCIDCLPASISSRREHFTGVFTWALPANVLRFTIKVRVVGVAGSVTVTDNVVNTTPMFVGDEESWGNGSDPLNLPFTVDGVDAGDIVTVFYEVVV